MKMLSGTYWQCLLSKEFTPARNVVVVSMMIMMMMVMAVVMVRVKIQNMVR